MKGLVYNSSQVFSEWVLGEKAMYAETATAVVDIMVIACVAFAVSFFLTEKGLLFRILPVVLMVSTFRYTWSVQLNAGKCLVSLVTFTYMVRLWEICILRIYDYESLRERMLQCFGPVIELCLKQQAPADSRKRLKLFGWMLFEMVANAIVYAMAIVLIQQRYEWGIPLFVVYGLCAVTVLTVLTVEGVFNEMIFLVLDGSIPPKLMVYPYLSLSVREFWSKRWNRAVHYLLKRYIYIPAKVQLGLNSKVATFLTFVGSGVYHIVPLYVGNVSNESLLSMVLFFVLQAIFMIVEVPLGEKHWPTSLRWLWVFCCTFGPVKLFVSPYLELIDFTP
uniref:Wax synthase domain-containing protein n=1 Tax=Mucochytrium quahogii TaxID=96639 RepID=A0A7S2W7R6_9STRA|mmetsp:Transcript_20026/g.33046  ORF Transcript_20026/g.33046 Transcript_20026/m.33046 type:complete len:334 (+) Transcript_20026:80-1081(+)